MKRADHIRLKADGWGDMPYVDRTEVECMLGNLKRKSEGRTYFWDDRYQTIYDMIMVGF